MPEFWRQRMHVRSITASGLPTPDGRAPIVHIIEGPNADEDMAWLNAGKGCPTCVLKFPEKPAKRWWHLFRGNEWGCPEAEAKRRVYAGCCPCCGDPVETEITQAQYVDPRPDWEHPDEQLRRDIEQRPIGSL